MFTVIDPYRFAVPPDPTDPDFENVILLLHLDGADSSTTFTDSSSYNRTVSATGPTALDTATPKFGSAALTVPGSGGISLPYSAEMDLSTDDFTIEFWFRTPTNEQVTFFDSTTVADSRFPVVITTYLGTGIAAAGSDAAGNTCYACTAMASVFSDSWHHLALVRFGSVFTLYIDGVGSPSTLPAYAGALGQLVSAWRMFSPSPEYGASSLLVDEVRVTTGARYISNFTPPSEPFLGG